MAAVTIPAARDTAEEQATRQDMQVGLVFVAICITAVATVASPYSSQRLARTAGSRTHRSNRRERSSGDSSRSRP